MFHRFSEAARFSVFMARGEASAAGSRWIESHHLLLGILRVCTIAGVPAEAIRAELELQFPSGPGPIPTDVDLPLSREAKDALRFAAGIERGVVTPVHLILGLLKVEKSAAAAALQRRGVTLKNARELAKELAPAERDRPEDLPFGDVHPPSSPNREVERLEERLRRAMLAGDVPELEKLISDDLVFVGPDGSLATKAADLEAHRSRAVQFKKLDPTERQIQRHGEVAVVIVRMAVACTFHGAPVSGDFRYTRVWRMDADLPQVVAGHVSAILSKQP